jgi:hypothetical protein
MKMHTPRFDIFVGEPSSIDRDAVWMETVDGVIAACERMTHYATRTPGSYFVFSMSRSEVIAAMDTSGLAKA